MSEKIKVPKWMASESEQGQVFVFHSRKPFLIAIPVSDSQGKITLKPVKIIEDTTPEILLAVLKDGTDWYFFKHVNKNNNQTL